MDAKTFEAIIIQMGIKDFTYGQYLQNVEHSKYSGEDIQKVSRYFERTYGEPTYRLLGHQCSNLSKAIQENEFSETINILKTVKTICLSVYIRGYFDGRGDNAGTNPES